MHLLFDSQFYFQESILKIHWQNLKIVTKLVIAVLLVKAKTGSNSNAINKRLVE